MTSIAISFLAGLMVSSAVIFKYSGAMGLYSKRIISVLIKIGVVLCLFVVGYVAGNTYPTFKVLPITENELPDTLAPIVGDLKEFNDKMEEK